MMFEYGNTEEFNNKLLDAFRSIKRLEVAETLFNLFKGNAGYATGCIPTRKWTKTVLMHLNTINSFPGHPERVPLRMTNSEIEKVIKLLKNANN